MTEQNEQPDTMILKMAIPEGDVVIMFPTPLSVESAEKASTWIRIMSRLEGVEIKE